MGPLPARQGSSSSSPRYSLQFLSYGWRTVSSDGHIEVDRAFYSVPNQLLGCEVQVHWDDCVVRIYFRDEQVVLHPKQTPGRFQTKDEHLPESKRYVRWRTEGQLLSQAARGTRYLI